ncbi:hypothetical protein B0H11DRAFT_2227311 [Mycena galericulata]|nr:hypothetical protein B0H11DRAFT_2227311 [Mycena galericulata]
MPPQFLYTFPQSVGIAGGRPSSSYYCRHAGWRPLLPRPLDPHHSRPAVPLRPFVPHAAPADAASQSPSRHSQAAHPHTHGAPGRETYVRGGSISPEYGYARGGSLSPKLVGRTGSMSPEYGQGRGHTPMTEDELLWGPADTTPHGHTTLTGMHVDAPPANSSAAPTTSSTRPPAGGWLTPAEEAHFLRTFHCECVRKMPLTGLSPSMLIGFVCRDEAE